MVSGPITSREIDGETVADFIFLGSKITEYGYCSHKIKRCLFLGTKAMINVDGILKSRGITLLTKVHLVKAMIFPIVLYGCKSLTIKKAEHWRIDAFELWFWRRLLRVPWTARRSNQSVLKIIHPESWNSSALATWLEELIFWRRLCCWERLRAGGEGYNREGDCWLIPPTLWKCIWESSVQLVMDREVWSAAVLGFTKSQTTLGYWTELNR